jgi:spore coat protein H
VLIDEVDTGVFELSVSPEMQNFLYSSKDTAYTVQDPDLMLIFQDRRTDLREIRVRGRTTLDYRRKSFGVKLNKPIFIRDREGKDYKELRRFKLISLSMDYCYMNNRLAFRMLEQAGVMQLFYRYVHFYINGENQGVYLLVEDPEQYFLEQGSEYILRRDYHHGIEDSEYEPRQYNIPRDTYKARFREIYELLPDLQGEALFQALDQRVDLTQYFRKMGIDFLLRNGDFTDEVFFYSQVRQGNISFRIIPWDYDDIFSTYPHEVGRSWGIGKQFGNRSYDTQQDIYDEIGEKMVFSIEDDLDYAIARDSFLYARYEQSLSEWLEEIKPGDVDALFDGLEKELGPYFLEEEVIAQSQYDLHPTSPEQWQTNMAEKRILIKDRLEMMKVRLQKTNNQQDP